MQTQRIVAEEDVARIAALGDPVLRNALITQCYHELAVALRERLGTGANWCTFATWASQQAGRSIRRQDLRDALRLQLGASAEARRRLDTVAAALRRVKGARDGGGLLDRVLTAVESASAFDRASAAVAAGNLKVFDEIAREFARFLAATEHDDAAAWTRFVDGLRPGGPPDGQQLLREAFEECRATRTEPDPTLRAQRLFHANLLTGLHEQTRLQPQIAAAMNAAFDAGDVKRRLLAELLPVRWLRVRYGAAALFGRTPPLDVAIDSLLEVVQREMRRVITANAMTLHLPQDEIVRLGRDVGGAFPPELEVVAHPALAALLRRVDPTTDSVAGSGAGDWAVLDQRMHLITDLFRSRHAWPSLFDPPFTPGQVEKLRAGILPDLRP